jgi:hypothetical protein
MWSRCDCSVKRSTLLSLKISIDRRWFLWNYTIRAGGGSCKSLSAKGYILKAQCSFESFARWGARIRQQRHTSSRLCLMSDRHSLYAWYDLLKGSPRDVRMSRPVGPEKRYLWISGPTKPHAFLVAIFWDSRHLMGLLGLEAEIEPYNVDNEGFWTDRHDAGKLIIWDRKKILCQINHLKLFASLSFKRIQSWRYT